MKGSPRLPRPHDHSVRTPMAMAQSVRVPVSPKSSYPCTDPARVRGEERESTGSDASSGSARAQSCPPENEKTIHRPSPLLMAGMRAVGMSKKDARYDARMVEKARSMSPVPLAKKGDEWGFLPANSPTSRSPRFPCDAGRQIAHAFFTAEPNQAIRSVQQWAKEGKPLNPEAVATFMHRCAKAGLACPEDLLVYFTQQLNAKKGSSLSNRAVSAICYGLQHSHDGPELRALQAAIAEAIETSENLTFDDQAIWNSLFGLQRSADCAESRALVLALAKKIADAPDAVVLNCHKS